MSVVLEGVHDTEGGDGYFSAALAMLAFALDVI